MGVNLDLFFRRILEKGNFEKQKLDTTPPHPGVFGNLMGVLGYLMGVLGYLMGVLGYLMGVLGSPMAWRRR